MDIIRNKNHPLFLEIMDIRNKNNNGESDVRIVEGGKMIQEAFQCGILPEFLFFSESFACEGLAAYTELIASAEHVLIFANHLFGKICVAKSPQGAAASIRFPISLIGQTFHNTPETVYMVCDEVQDPGNVGNLIRIADAFNVKGIIFNHQTAHPSNEKVIRASMGSVFRVHFLFTPSIGQTLEDLAGAGITTYGTDLSGSDITATTRFQKPLALVFGNEGRGLSSDVLEHCAFRIRIPMSGQTQSLNVASAAAILTFLASGQMNSISI